MFGFNKISFDPTATNDQIRDAQVLAAKKENMAKLKWNSILGSASRALGFIAGPLLAAGVVAGLGKTLAALSGEAVVKGGASALTEATTATAAVAPMELGAAIAAGFTVPVIGTLIVGAALAAVSIGADYLASRIWQSKTFDNFELNAQSTAHHMVQELKANGVVIEQPQAPARQEGKSWVQYEEARRTSVQPGVSL
jgi:hypothetical protein